MYSITISIIPCMIFCLFFSINEIFIEQKKDDTTTKLSHASSKNIRQEKNYQHEQCTRALQQKLGHTQILTKKQTDLTTKHYEPNNQNEKSHSSQQIKKKNY